MIRSLSMRNLLTILSAAAGVLFIIAGVLLWSVPAGLIVAGLVLLAVAYVARYLEVQTE